MLEIAHFFDVVFTLSKTLELPKMKSLNFDHSIAQQIMSSQTTSIYDQADSSQTISKRFKYEPAVKLRPRKTEKYSRDRRLQWVIKNASKVRGNIIQYGEQVSIFTEENRRLRDQLIHSNNQLADHIQRMREKPRKRQHLEQGLL